VSADRRLLPLLATAALMLPAGLAWAQSGAGDDQYTDPFAGEQRREQAQPRQRQAAQQPPGEDEPGLSEQPPVTPGEPAPAPSPAPAEPAPTEAAPQELPNTGYEIPAIALLGLGLLVSGIGLRLRTVDDTLF
jgi:LPXTG-motif cell wall-anchored protein